MKRTDDLTYSQSYWQSLDNGAGYVDSVLWEDLALITKEVLFYGPHGEDLSAMHNILDLGCAFGYLVKHLRRRGVEAWGADISAYAIAHADPDYQPYLKVFDLVTDEPGVIPGFPFDFIACYETMEHIPEENLPRALASIDAMLKPGGVALFTICLEDRDGWDTDPTHVNIQSRGYWIAKFEELGFIFQEERQTLLKNFHLFKDHNGLFVIKKPSKALVKPFSYL